jgi:hypothetical protein
MRLGYKTQIHATFLATLLGACNSSLPENPVGLECDPNRNPPCAGGFICVDDLCVHPSSVDDGGVPWQNTAALQPNASTEHDETSREVRSGDVPAPTTGGDTTRDEAIGETTASEQTVVLDESAPPRPSSDVTPGQGTNSDVTDRADATSRDTNEEQTGESSNSTGSIDSAGGATTSASPTGANETGDSETTASETTAPPATTTTTDPTNEPDPTEPTSCSVSCIAPQHGSATCQGDVCTIECQSKRTKCDGLCVDTDNDVAHCGECGEACDSVVGGSAKCDKGVCGIACNGGLTLCNGACIDTKTTLAHCGECNAACVAPANASSTCSGGDCTFTCSDGFTECSDSCVDSQNDANHCGDCQTQCEASDGVPFCNAGECDVECEAGKTYCDGECVDLQRDRDNCGECGRSCLLGGCDDGGCFLDL